MANPRRAVYQSYVNYILSDATWTANVAPLTTYAVTTFGYLLPMWRVKWGVTTVTITATLPASRQGDVIAIPITNLDAGALSVTNGSGLNQPMVMPALSAGGWPATAWIDLTDPALNGGSGWSTGQRTSNVWRFVIAGNSKNVTMGGALWISGPITSFPHTVDIGSGASSAARRQDPTLTHDYARILHTNEYNVDFVQDLQTSKRTFKGSYNTHPASMRDSLLAWMDGSHGGSLPGLWVRDTNVNDAFLAYLTPSLSGIRITDQVEWFSVTMTELSKGVPLL